MQSAERRAKGVVHRRLHARTHARNNPHHHHPYDCSSPDHFRLQRQQCCRGNVVLASLDRDVCWVKQKKANARVGADGYLYLAANVMSVCLLATPV